VEHSATGSSRTSRFDRRAAHERATRQLLTQYRSLPARSGVRLAKATSNLFRFRPPAAGHALDVSDFNHVIAIDPVARTADVQGMITYADLVDATLLHGLMPLVVPQLRTITLGGAVAGLGIESTSFRNGLPHESVREMEILTGDGRVVLARPDNEHADLFRGFPNSYGTLGYALRLVIDLEPALPTVALRHLRFHQAEDCFAALEEICANGMHDGTPVDFVDGVFFAPDELYLTLATFVSSEGPHSDFTGMDIYYQSIRARATDRLTVHDYLWRWDTDWFWCSRALGAQRPAVRRLWPRRYRRSDIYRKLVAFDRRHQLSARWDSLHGRRPQEPVVQDIEVPIAAGVKFLDFFHSEIGIAPVWLCPLRLRDTQAWPLYPLEPGELYVNLGFWSSVRLRPGQVEGHHNRLIEQTVTALGGHKSLYSTAYYSPEEFWRLYNGGSYTRLKTAYDPDGRLPDLYDKCVRQR
jgi:FAD/FMN-containing dehydrogenase